MKVKKLIAGVLASMLTLTSAFLPTEESTVSLQPAITVEASETEQPESGSCGDNVVWELKDGTLTISGTGSMTDFGCYDNYSPFFNRSDITAVVIEEGVTNIGEYAFFGCSNITSVNAPSSLTNIGESAFYGCSNLTDINLPEPEAQEDYEAPSEVPEADAEPVVYNEINYAASESEPITTDIPSRAAEYVVTVVSVVTSVKPVVVTSVMPVVVTSVMPVVVTSVMPVDVTQIVTVPIPVTIPETVISLVPITSISKVVTSVSVVPVTSVSEVVTSISVVPVTSVNEVVTSVSVVPVTSVEKVTEIVHVTVPEYVTSIIPVTNIFYVTIPEYVTSIIPVTVPEYVTSIVPVTVPEYVTSIVPVTVPEYVTSIVPVTVPEYVTSIIPVTVPEYVTSIVPVTVPEYVTSIVPVTVPEYVTSIVPVTVPELIPIYVTEVVTSVIPVTVPEYIPVYVTDVVHVTEVVTVVSVVTSVETAVTKVNATVDNDDIALIEKGEPLTIIKDGCTFVFDTNAVDVIKQQIGDKGIVLSYNVVAKDAVSNDKIQEAAVNYDSLLNFELNDSDGNKIEFSSAETGGNVNITIPYSSPYRVSKVDIYYIAPDGSSEKLENIHYNSINETISFDTSHFSYYAVKTADENGVIAVKPEVTEAVTSTGESTVTTVTTTVSGTATDTTTTLPQTGNNVSTNFVITVSALLLAISGAFVMMRSGIVIRRKNN